MFQMLPSAKSGRCESNTKLSLFVRICHSTGSRAGGEYPLSKHGEVKTTAVQNLTKFKAGWLYTNTVNVLAKSCSRQSKLIFSVTVPFISPATNTFMNLFFHIHSNVNGLNDCGDVQSVSVNSIFRMERWCTLTPAAKNRQGEFINMTIQSALHKKSKALKIQAFIQDKSVVGATGTTNRR